MEVKVIQGKYDLPKTQWVIDDIKWDIIYDIIENGETITKRIPLHPNNSNLAKVDETCFFYIKSVPTLENGECQDMAIITDDVEVKNIIQETLNNLKMVIKNKIISIFTDLKEGYKNLPRSVIFWNLLIILFIICTLFYSVELFQVVQIFSSIIALGIVFDGDADENHLWIIATAFFWIMLCFGLIVGVIVAIIMVLHYYFDKFNDWLNNLGKK